MATKTKTRTVCFYTLGPEFTRTVRDLWLDDKPLLALHCLMDGNESVPLEIVLGILTGTHMLVGDSRDKAGMSIGPDPAGPRIVSACHKAPVYFASDGLGTVIDFCVVCHKHCSVVAYRQQTPPPMTDKYLASLNVKTHQRDPNPVSPWTRRLNRAFGWVLLLLLITALVKCS